MVMSLALESVRVLFFLLSCSCGHRCIDLAVIYSPLYFFATDASLAILKTILDVWSGRRALRIGAPSYRRTSMSFLKLRMTPSTWILALDLCRRPRTDKSWLNCGHVDAWERRKIHWTRRVKVGLSVRWSPPNCTILSLLGRLRWNPSTLDMYVMQSEARVAIRDLSCEQKGCTQICSIS